VRPRSGLLSRVTIDRDLNLNLNLYLIVTLIVAAMVAFSAVAKIRRDPHVVRTIHEIVGMPLSYFPLLAACEFAGAVGLILGMFWPMLGIFAGVGLAVYFVVAILSHFRVGDFKGVGPAFFMWVAVMLALGMRLHLGPHPHWYRL
jgi:DoxX-like family